MYLGSVVSDDDSKPEILSRIAQTTRRGFWGNAGEWTGRVKISKEEILGSKRSMCGYILTCCRLLRENL